MFVLKIRLFAQAKMMNNIGVSLTAVFIYNNTDTNNTDDTNLYILPVVILMQNYTAKTCMSYILRKF